MRTYVGRVVAKGTLKLADASGAATIHGDGPEAETILRFTECRRR